MRLRLLDAVIQELKRNLSARLDVASSAVNQSETLKLELMNVATERQSLASAALEQAHVLKDQREEALAEMRERHEQKLTTDTMRLESEKKRMELARSHLERDSANLQEEREQVTDAIRHETRQHDEEGQNAQALREVLDQEIHELQKTLESKIAQRNALSNVMNCCEIRTASIRAKFEKQVSRLDLKARRLEETNREVELDSQQVEQLAIEVQQEKNDCAEAVMQCEQQISTIVSESHKFRRHRRFVSRLLKMRARWQKMLEPHQEKLRQARLQWDAVTNKSQELASGVATCEAQVSKLRSQVEAIRLQIPSLEAERNWS